MSQLECFVKVHMPRLSKPEPIAVKARHVDSGKLKVLMYKPNYSFTERLRIKNPLCAGCWGYSTE